MASLRKIKLGAFAAGEIPNPISHQFKDYAGNPIPMAGWTILGFYVEGDAEVQGSTTWGDQAEGIVTYTWHPDDLSVPGRYTGLLWVQNDTTNPVRRYASDLFEWFVVDGPGPTPPTTP